MKVIFLTSWILQLTFHFYHLSKTNKLSLYKYPEILLHFNWLMLLAYSDITFMVTVVVTMLLDINISIKIYHDTINTKTHNWHELDSLTGIESCCTMLWCLLGSVSMSRYPTLQMCRSGFFLGTKIKTTVEKEAALCKGMRGVVVRVRHPLMRINKTTTYNS